MFLKVVKSKGKNYFYLCKYSPNKEDKKAIIYRFGRSDEARETIKRWLIDKETIPRNLQQGIKINDLILWYEKLNNF